MANKASSIQKARLLSLFLCHADAKGSIASDNKGFFQELGQIFSNGNVLDQHLYDLNEAGSVHYEAIGEDGFAPIIIASCTSRTAAHLSALLEEIDADLAGLNRRITEILTFDPDRLKSDIESAKAQLQDARSSAQANELLKPLLGPITQIDRHLQGVAAVADRYEDVYRNIIRQSNLRGNPESELLFDGQSSVLSRRQ